MTTSILCHVNKDQINSHFIIKLQTMISVNHYSNLNIFIHACKKLAESLLVSLSLFERFMEFLPGIL